LAPSLHQLPTVVLALVALWKPTMLRIERWRCWHSQPLPQVTALT